jgi:PAS domain S-box-containing protein
MQDEVKTKEQLIAELHELRQRLAESEKDKAERKLAEEALRERDIHFKKLSSHVPGMIYQFMKRLDGTYCVPFTTEAIKDIFGCSPQDVREDFSPITRVILSEDLDRLIRLIESSAEHMTTWQFEFRVQIPGRPIRWMLGHSTPEQLADGSIIWHGFNTDITERKRAEDLLHKYAFIVGATPDLMSFVDTSYRYQAVNEAYLRAHQKTRDEIIGYSVADLHGAEVFNAIIKSEIDRCLAGEQIHYSAWFDYAGLGRRFVDVIYNPYRDRQDAIAGVVVSVRDITERKRIEDALSESEEHYRLMAENIQDVFWIATSNIEKMLYISPAYERIWGRSCQTLYDLPSSWIEAIHPQDREHVLNTHAHHHSQGTASRLEYRIIRPDGTERWVEDRSFPVFDENGNQYLNTGIAIDITERKQAEEALRASQQLIEGIINAIPVRVFWKDKNLVFLGCNAVFARDAGFADSKDIIGKDDYQMGWRDQAELYRGDDHQVIESGCSKFLIEEPQTTPEGNTITLLTSKIPLRNSKGEICGILGTYMDITERKRAEEKLRLTLADLERSNKELEQFAYVASHDLQEPLRTVSSCTQLLARRYQGKLGTDADEFIGYAVDGANRMQVLINDLLAYSRVGTRSDGCKPIDYTVVLDQALTNLKAAIEQSGAVVTHGPLPTVMADKLQLAQLFQNLIGNAIKFQGGEPPRIHVSAEQKGNEWIFSVRDNGVGINLQYAERIFVIFQRLHTREEYPGTGIGLAICKKIVERRGGRIWVESQLGIGSTFYFTIPIGDNML